MPQIILILEDNRARQAAMAAGLREHFPALEIEFHADAAGMIRAIGQRLPQTVAISLDHDLELQPTEDGRWHDPGTGRAVADHLSQFEPTCPVLIHSSNVDAAIGMELALQDGGWGVTRITPHGDLEWVRDWLQALRRVLRLKWRGAQLGCQRNEGVNERGHTAP